MTPSDGPPPTAGHKSKNELLEELKKAYERIASLESAEGAARTRAILDNISDGVVMIDSRGHIETFNPAAVAMFGYTAEEAIGRNISIPMTAFDQRAHADHLNRYIESGKSNILGVGPRELTGVRKDATTFPVELGIGEMWIDGERRFIGTLRDITRRKKMERALGESEAIVRVIADSLPVSISSFDTEGRYRFVNERWARWNQQSATEVVGNRVEDVIGPRRYEAI